MKTNVEFLNTSFYDMIDVENQIGCEIIARIMIENLPITKAEFVNEICKRFPDVSPTGTFKCFAVATCSPNDTFDVTVGEHIAETKAQQKVYKRALKLYSAIHNLIELKQQKLGEFLNGCYHSKHNSKTHIIMLDECHNNLPK
jgi:hypothetical protein